MENINEPNVNLAEQTNLMKKFASNNIEKNKKRFKKNILQLIIGIIFLFFGFVYMDKNPAEKVSIISGVKIIFQRFDVIYHNLFFNNGALLSEKYDLQKSFSELVTSYENSQCLSGNELLTVRSEYSKLLNMDLKTYETQRVFIDSFLKEYYTTLKAKCE